MSDLVQGATKRNSMGVDKIKTITKYLFTVKIFLKITKVRILCFNMDVGRKRRGRARGKPGGK